jgi:capsular exopolysaccharide synthesis family protein
MTRSLDYLAILRRRWLIIVAAVVVAALVGVLTSLLAPAPTPPAPYEATTLLLGGRDGLGPGIENLDTLARLTTLDPVASRAAEALHLAGSPTTLAASVHAQGDASTGFLEITASASDPGRAEAVADAFANGLINYLETGETPELQKRAGSILEEIAHLHEQITSLTKQIASTTGAQQATLAAQRDVKESQLKIDSAEYVQLLGETSTPVGLHVVQPATASPSDPGIQIRSVGAILAVSVILGLMAGLVIALVLERLDPKIRTTPEAETRFGMPVLAEIPHLARRAQSGIVVAEHRRSPEAESFRLLATELASAAGIASGTGQRGAKIVLVTSAGPSDGKSTVVANLAVSLADSGKSVLVMSCDLLHPTIHERFGVANRSGLIDALWQNDGSSLLTKYVQPTKYHGVSLLPSGRPPERPGELTGSDRMRRVMKEARRIADVVLIDSAPLVYAADVAPFFPDADAVLVVARVGRTKAVVAERTAEFLRRMKLPVIGVALNDATEMSRTGGADAYQWPRTMGNGDGGTKPGATSPNGGVRERPDSDVTPGGGRV